MFFIVSYSQIRYNEYMANVLCDDLIASVALSFFEGIGPARYDLLISYYGSPSGIYKAKEVELLKLGLPKSIVYSFCSFRSFENIALRVNEWEKNGIHIITRNHEHYPESLKNQTGAPIALYAIGDISLLNQKNAIAIVGTRSPSPYGVLVTRLFARGIAQEGLVIISGMALGIDAIAHKETLDIGGKTIAVLGCGVDICYPAANRVLYETIKVKGLVLSEFPPGKRTSKHVFPARNRIIASMSDGILITEGAPKSGTLITARLTTDYNRELLVVPGNIFSGSSKGVHQFLKLGAGRVSADEAAVG